MEFWQNDWGRIMGNAGYGTRHNMIKCVGHDRPRTKAAEGSRTPRRWRVFRERIEAPKVLACGCPLPLFLPGNTLARCALPEPRSLPKGCVVRAHFCGEIDTSAKNARCRGRRSRGVLLRERVSGNRRKRRQRSRVDTEEETGQSKKQKLRKVAAEA